MNYLTIKTSKKIANNIQNTKNIYGDEFVTEYIYSIVSKFIKYEYPMMPIFSIYYTQYFLFVYNESIIMYTGSHEQKYNYLLNLVWEIFGSDCQQFTFYSNYITKLYKINKNKDQ